MNQLLRTRTAWVLTLGVLCSTGARADFYLHHWLDLHESGEVFTVMPEVSYYMTQNNFDAQGVTFTPGGLNGAGIFLADATVKYGLSSRFTLFGRASWSFTRLDSSTDPQAGMSFGFRDQTAGAGFRVLEIKHFHELLGYSVDLQAQVDFPLYSNQPTATSGPFLGDGSIDFTAGVFATAPIVQGKFGGLGVTVGGGYTYRTGGFSSAIPYSAALKFVPIEQGWFGELQGVGIYSLRTDIKTALVNTPGITAATLSPGAGGSFVVNAVDPSHFTARAVVGYQLSNSTKVYLAASQALFGQLAPVGTMGLLGAEIRLGAVPSRDPIHLSPKEYGRSNQGLQSYSLDAHVLKASDRLNLVKIDRGSQDGVEVGQVFDIFIVNTGGSAGEAVARAKVVSLKPAEAALSVTEYFKEVWIDEGFLAKRLIPSN